MLRTLLQARRRVDAGRWARNCARDYYDLWRLAGSDVFVIDWKAVAAILPQKCGVREVAYASVDDFVDATIVAEARRQWQGSLANLVRDLPVFDGVIREVRTRLSAVL